MQIIPSEERVSVFHYEKFAPYNAGLYLDGVSTIEPKAKAMKKGGKEVPAEPVYEIDMMGSSRTGTKVYIGSPNGSQGEGSFASKQGVPLVYNYDFVCDGSDTRSCSTHVGTLPT